MTTRSEIHSKLVAVRLTKSFSVAVLAWMGRASNKAVSFQTFIPSTATHNRVAQSWRRRRRRRLRLCLHMPTLPNPEVTLESLFFTLRSYSIITKHHSIHSFASVFTSVPYHIHSLLLSYTKWLAKR